MGMRLKEGDYTRTIYNIIIVDESGNLKEHEEILVVIGVADVNEKVKVRIINIL